jgi:GNAT superfamily N-acetyltransferase
MMIRESTSDDHAAVIQIAESLPEWFDETARRRSIPIDVKHQGGFVALLDGVVVGFVTLYVSEGRVNMGWLAVRREFHRQGIGRALLARVAAWASELGIGEIATCTLGDGVDYAPFEQTRRFYFRNGFEVYQRSQTDNPGCPEEIRIRKKVPA